MKSIIRVLGLLLCSCLLFVWADRTLYYGFYRYSLFSYSELPYGTKCGPADRLSAIWSFGGREGSYSLELREYEYSGTRWEERAVLPVEVHSEQGVDSLYVDNIIDYALSNGQLIILLEDIHQNRFYIKPESVGKHQYINVLLNEEDVQSMPKIRWVHLSHHQLIIALCAWLPLLLLSIGLFVVLLYRIDKIRR